MANETPRVARHSSKSELGNLEGWLACLVVWVGCISLALSIVCFMLGPTE
jgi:hypothetical protein